MENAEGKLIPRSACVGYLHGQCVCFGAFRVTLFMFVAMVIEEEFLATLYGLNPSSNIA